MLRIYSVVVELMVELRPVLAELRRRDRGLWWQCKEALQSVLLNLSEGSAGVGGNRGSRYASSLGSMRETWACLDAAVAFGWIAEPAPSVRSKMNQIIGTLVKVTQPRT